MQRINGKLARALAAMGLAAIVALVAGCGGGGGSSSSPASNSSTNSNTGSTTGGTTNTTGTSTPANNQVAVAITSGLRGNTPNLPMVSVTVCVPGTSNCQTINNIQLDTGSFGLRLASDAVTSTLLGALPVETVSGKSVAECMSFADGNAWGSVRTADVTIGSETASSIPVHILGDMSQSTTAGSTDNSCSSGTLNNSSTALSAHGILGIGSAKYDCGSGVQGCTSAPNGVYFGCTTSGTTTCADLGVPVAQQVINPIQAFPTDNNGAILSMPALAATGATSASGMLTFGIGTQANNALPSSGVQKVTTDHFGSVRSASLSGTGVTTAFFDSGSSALFFPDNAIATCTRNVHFYCPSSSLSLQPTVTGYNSVTTAITVNIGNADALLGTGVAFNDIAVTTAGTLNGFSAAFDFGMPFFYGRTVYVSYDPSPIDSFGSASPAFVAF